MDRWIDGKEGPKPTTVSDMGATPGSLIGWPASCMRFRVAWGYLILRSSAALLSVQWSLEASYLALPRRYECRRAK